jgi:ubiquinone/menaquinone biosynthesis C-methylase UbiE
LKIARPEKRLSLFWGKVDEKNIKSFFPFIQGNNILDIGCGNGSTVNFVTKHLNCSCIGIDDNSNSISIARKLFPDCNFTVANCENLPFDDGYFDTIILRDTLHHLYQEADFEKVKKELNRISNRNTVFIIFDPNINFLLRMFRIFIYHKDAECTFEQAKNIISDFGCKIIHNEFNTIFSLPLSGGYVGINFVPQIKSLQSFILFMEEKCEKIINKLGLGKYFCLRYLIISQKLESDTVNK